jgi:hypothetical protein
MKHLVIIDQRAHLRSARWCINKLLEQVLIFTNLLGWKRSGAACDQMVRLPLVQQAVHGRAVRPRDAP